MKTSFIFIFMFCLVVGIVKDVKYLAAQPGGGFMGGGGVSATTIIYLEDGTIIPICGLWTVQIGSLVDVNGEWDFLKTLKTKEQVEKEKIVNSLEINGD